MSTKTAETPYQEALDYCERARSAALGKEQFLADSGTPAPPAPLRQLLVEEAFSLFNTTLGVGLDEEALTAVFMACWVSSYRFWQRNWIWSDPSPHTTDMMWLHFNKTSETRLGADFAMAIATEDGNFDVVIAQAKKYSSEQTNCQNFERLAFHRSEEAAISPAEARAKAEIGLNDILFHNKKCSDIITPEWQFTRFLSLQKEIDHASEPHTGTPTFLYVSWPEKSGLPPLYKYLNDVRAEIEKKEINKDTKRRTQSYQLDQGALFRDLLVTENISKEGSLSFSRTKAVLEYIKNKCTALIVVDVTGHNFGNDLANELEIPNLQMNYVPSPQSGLGQTLQCGKC